ncbi:MAG: HRDC domain-containing protein [Actinomycetaceae bacterium]|nr:HRDC domain-containing protein [Arcanobacterium sp.]MDD7686550.1 HRDC domain-containing protein [Actinomycetaceae bacterium]MDY5272830.1 HRDC domain-containing protein [Arcanobacterium sp.]
MNTSASLNYFHHERDAVPLLTPRDGLPDVTHHDIAQAITALSAGHGAFAIDTERAQGIRYSERAYLVQIRRAGAGTFLIDPVGIERELAPLARVMHDEWILHAADSDLPSLHELGLFPTKIFDTEIAALLLGFEHVSLQALAAEILGQELAKEYSHSDWSARPLSAEQRTYAALDVELLHELKEALTGMLQRASRLEWCEQECEAVRLKPPPPAKQQPWRKAAHQADVHDRRALAMLRELWAVRDKLARERDIPPTSVLPNVVLGQLAKRKPRSRADVARSSLLRSHERQRDVAQWWHAINKAWHLPYSALPARTFTEKKALFPPVKRWGASHPDAMHRWEQLRLAVLIWADELGIRQDILLKPALQKRIAWEGWADTEDFAEKLALWGARPWQITQVRIALFHKP